MQDRRLSYRSIWAAATPIMLSNVSTPLLGLVDTAIIGRLPGPEPLGAVALGSLIFTFVFWAFGFLRMGTTGLTAQAKGRDDAAEVRAQLLRALLLAAAVGVVLVAFQQPILSIALSLLDGSATVEAQAAEYFSIRIAAAPAALSNYALLGWFIGLRRTRTGLVLQLLLNCCNMLLDAIFALGLHWGVSGVAWGTLIAEYIAASVGLGVAFKGFAIDRQSWSTVIDWLAFRRMLLVNVDIMVRSLALVSAFAWFTSQGAKQGDVILAANSVLTQLLTFAAFFLDGIAFAAEAFVGHAIGSRSRSELWAAMTKSTHLAVLLAAAVSLGFLVLGPQVVEALTTDPAVRSSARHFLPWAVFAPIVGVWCFQLDGIFIGATRSVEMRNAMLGSLGIFLLAWWLLTPWGNHGLWASLYVHYLARTITLLVQLPKLLRSTRVTVP